MNYEIVLAEDFFDAFRQLSQHVREKARKNYRLWKENPYHPSLQFKRVHPTEPLYSARVGDDWRVLGLREADAIYWFWIGSHAEYDQIIRRY